MNQSSKTGSLILVSLVVIGIATLAMAIIVFVSLPSDPEQQVVTNAKKLAGELSDNNLHEAAIEEYRKILNAFPLDDRERGAINYLIGKIYFEDIGDYERAAAHYIKARSLDEEGSYFNEAGKNLITCLERLGRKLDARRELDRQSSPEPDTSKTEGKLVAKVGSSEITLADFNEALQSVPQEMQDRFTGPEGKKEFLNQLIGRELIYHAAIREGYDKESSVRKDLKDLEKEYLIQYYTQQKIIPTIKPDTAGFSLYYQAHKEDYDNKPLEEIQSQVMQDYMSYLGQKASREYINDLLEAEPVQTFEENLK
jgi:tetratricopeptide (TPR) repeat protein